MSRAQRDKGLKGEHEAAGLFVQAGWVLRGLESSGDWLAVNGYGFGRERVAGDTTLHLEIKRQEVLRVPLWLRQARDEAPPGVPPVLVFRQNRGEWYACLPLADLLTLIG